MFRHISTIGKFLRDLNSSNRRRLGLFYASSILYSNTSNSTTSYHIISNTAQQSAQTVQQDTTSIGGFSILIIGGLVLLLTLVLALFYNKSPFARAIQDYENTKDRSLRELGFNFLVCGISFLLSSAIYNLYYPTNAILTLFDIAFGSLGILTFVFASRLRQIAPHLETLLTLVFFFLGTSTFFKIVSAPYDIFSFCCFAILAYVSFSVLKSMRYFWMYNALLAITLLGLLVLNFLPDKTVLSYLYCLFFTVLINYSRFLYIRNFEKKLLFTSKIVNHGSSLVVGSNSNEQLVFVSENVKEILGYEKDELHSTNWFKRTLAPEDNEETILQKIREAKHQGKIYSRKLITANGGYKWIQWQYKKFGGELWIGIGQDITEQMKIQEQYQNLIQSATDIIHKTDNKGHFTFFNRHVKNLLGYDAEELIGKPYIHLIRKDYAKKVASFYAKNQNKGNYGTIEFPAIRKDGETVWLSQNVTVEKDGEGNATSYNAIVRDITALKYAELEKERKQAKIEYNSKLLRELTLSPLARKNNLAETLKNIIEIASRGLMSDRISIWICKNETIESHYFYEQEQNRHWNNATTLNKADHPIYFNILRQGEIIVAKDVSSHEATKDFFKDYFQDHDAKSLLDVPIFLDAKLEGVLCCESIKNFKEWDSEDINFARSITGLITLAIESNKRRVAESQLADRSKILSAVAKTTEQLLISHNILKTLGECLQYLGESISASRVYLYKADEEKKEFTIQHEWYANSVITKCVSHWKNPRLYDKLQELLRQRDNEHFATTLSKQIQNNDIRNFLQNQQIKAVLILPIYLEDTFYGLLGIDDDEHERNWPLENIQLIQSLTNNIANAIDRLNKELKIQESENNFREINESIEDVFWLYDNKKHKYLYISPSCETVLGMAQAEFYAGENYGARYVLEEDLLNYTNAQNLLRLKKSYEIEYRIRTSKGGIKWINEKSSAIVNEEGELIRNSGTCSDITEKKQFLNKINQLSLVAEKTNNGVLILDRNGFAVWANQSYLNTLEITTEQLLNKRPGDLFHYGELNKNHKLDAINGTNYTIVFEVLTFKQNKKYLEINNTIIEDEEGNTVQQIQILTDITHKKIKDLELAQHRAMLRKYSSNLEYQNELKEKLIKASSIEEITRLALMFVKENIKNCIHISLLTLDEKKQFLSGYFILKDAIEKERHHVKDLKSIEIVKNGDMFVEADLPKNQNKSTSDNILINYGAISYIVLPLLDETELIGIVTITFDTPYTFSESENESLKNFAMNLSTTIVKLNLKNSLQEKNNDIKDSLNYAKNIQKTMLPNLRDGFDSLSNLCLFFKPKDIVSGDFYWAKETDDYLFVALGDCTGHGVPGAFLTIIGTRLLEQIVRETNNPSTADIITQLDEQLYKSLNSNTNDIIRDGMEMALCLVNKKTNTLQFSGVGMGLVYFIDEEEIYIKGQRGSVGDYTYNELAFEQFNIALCGKERFFMASDGYQDQLGGKNYKRYSKRRLMDDMKLIKDLDGPTQEKTLKENLKLHMKENFQTDDISVLGFQIKLSNHE